MTPVNAVVRNGKIEIAAPIELTDGTEVRVWLDVAAQDEGPMSPEEIERTLLAMAQVQPLEITEHDRQQWQLSLNQQKEQDANSSESRVAKLLSRWE